MYLIKIRAVREGDKDFLFNLKNEHVSLRYSFKPHKVQKREHEKWFKRIANSTEVKQLIITGKGNKPIGQARFNINPEANSAGISVSIVPEMRGKGYGSKIIGKSSTYAIKKFRINKVYARIKKSNKASVRAFGKAGFKETDRKKYITMVFTG